MKSRQQRHAAIIVAACCFLFASACVREVRRDTRSQHDMAGSDLSRLIDLIETRYAYLDQGICNTRALRATLLPREQAARNAADRIAVLETALECLQDPHATLNTNLGTSTRLIPSGLEVWAEIDINDAAHVTQVRYGSSAWHAGIQIGDRIDRIGNIDTIAAIDTRTPCCARDARGHKAARQWSLLALLAGTHDRDVELSVLRDGRELKRRYSPAQTRARFEKPVEYRQLQDGSGYIALSDLGDKSSVTAFDQALQHLRHAPRLYLDLRNTPGGGNTDTAEPILGRLIDHKLPYQRIEPTHEKTWFRHVEPRGPWTYRGEIVVLVSRWTGSMGEGMAIGLDGMRRATICGSAMVGLKGAVFDHALPADDILVRLPGERLSHLNGTPREHFRPSAFLVDAEQTNGVDPATDTIDQWIQRSVTACARLSHGASTT